MQQPSGFAAAARFLISAMTGHVGVGAGGVGGGGMDFSGAELFFGHYVAGCEQHYHGRTPTIREFQEILNSSEEPLLLRVCYDLEVEGGHGRAQTTWVEYTRPTVLRGQGARNEGAFERPGDPPAGRPEAEWQPLRYSFSLGTYLSRVLYLKGEPSVVPNKVFRWVSGNLIADLVNDTRSVDTQTLKYLRLQEKRDNSLLVDYVHGRAIYRRSRDGGLGSEALPKSTEQQLIYSESQKRRLSPAFKEPLPEHVVEWLQGKCLASLVQGGGASGGQVVPTHSENVDELEWTSHGQWLRCRFESVPGGLLFVELNQDAGEEELVYSKELQSWISPSLTRRQSQAPAEVAIRSGEVPVPDVLIAWIKFALQQEKKQGLNACLAQYVAVPWWPILPCMQTGVPRGFRLALIGHKLMQKPFNNPMLVVEAMTHPSHKHATTGSYLRLAFLGSALMELIVSKTLVMKEGVPIITCDQLSPTQQEADVEQRFAAGVHAAIWAAGEPRTWPSESVYRRLVRQHRNGVPNQPSCPGRDPDATAARLRGQALACCNHTAYARACVRMDLHEHILHTSPELQKAIDRFACVAQRAERDDAQRKAQREAGGAYVDASPAQRRLIGHDAPRTLGDVFLACAAAVFLDTNWRTFQTIYRPVVEDLLDHIDHLGRSGLDPLTTARALAAERGLCFEVRVRTEEMTSPEELARFIRDSCGVEGNPVNTTSCNFAPGPHGSSEGEDQEQRQTQQLARAFALQDFHMCEPCLGGHAMAPPIVCPSPRAAALRCASYVTEQTVGLMNEFILRKESAHPEDIVGLHQNVVRALQQDQVLPCMPMDGVEQSSDDDSVDRVADTPKPNDEMGKKKVQPEWCDTCEMWLNGPTQMEDHKIGKKHKKNSGQPLATGTRKRGKKKQETQKQPPHPPQEMWPGSSPQLGMVGWYLGMPPPPDSYPPPSPGYWSPPPMQQEWPNTWWDPGWLMQEMWAE